MAIAKLLDSLWAAMEGKQGSQTRATFDRTQKRLGPCPDIPNCVSTQAPVDDAEHYIEPISYTGTVANARHHLLTVIHQMPLTTLITDEPDYLYFEFRTPLMRFVDDVEFYFDDEAHLIHFRSASRLGKGDMGTNRKRMEAIRQNFGKGR